MELIEKSEPEVDREIRELATRWAAAEVDSDVEVLDELLAEEFCGVGPFGFVLDKPAWLNRFASGLKNEALSLLSCRSVPTGAASQSMTLIAAAGIGSASLPADTVADGRSHRATSVRSTPGL
jgi:hypothetical protein